MEADILNGITRDSVIKIINASGKKVIQKNITIRNLMSADEIFMTGTAAEVKSVTQVNRSKIGNGKVGSLTKELQSSFMDAVMGKNKKFLPWLKFL